MDRQTMIRVVGVMGLAVAGGCSQDAIEVADEAPVDSKPEISVASVSSPGKPTVPVSVSYRFDTEPKAGEPLTVTVQVASRAVTNLSMTMTTRGPLELSKNTPASVPLKANASPAAPEEYAAVVTPEGDARGYLNVQITGDFEGQTFTRAVSIPVQVAGGSATLATNGTVIDTGVEVLSAMPATQTVTEVEPVQ